MSRRCCAGALFGSLVAGYVFARVSMSLISSRITDMPTAIIIQFASTFVVWILAEKLGLSGILTHCGLCGDGCPQRAGRIRRPGMRVPSYAVWETTVFVLNVLAFVLIGMQLRPIWEGFDDVRALAILRRGGGGAC